MKLDKRACRHAANVPLHISLNAGVLYTERVKYLVTAAVKLLGGHRVLAVYFYECERLKANDRMPKWVVFQGKDDFATLERDAEGNVKWRDSMLENLVDESFYKFRESCVFYKGTDGITISDFIHQSASGITILEALQVYQYGIRNKQAKKRRCKRDMGIVEKMKKVPAAPSNLARWIDRNVMPHYLFYSYDRNQPETQVFCTYCEKFSVIKKPKTGKIFVCPQCKQKAIAKAQGRRAAYHEDRETCQVIQKISDEELLIRIFKVRWAYKEKKNTPAKEIYENARLFIHVVGKEGTDTEAFYYDSSYDSTTHWRRGNRPRFSPYTSGYEADDTGAIYLPSLKRALQGTPWQYCALRQFYEPTKEAMQVSTYLRVYRRHPKLIEHLVKVGFERIVSDIVYAEHTAFLSCGTWSLLGTELDAPILTADSCQSGLSNEFGANGKINYLKNIIGLWLIQESRREYKRRGQAYSFAELEQQALAAEPLRSFIDPDAPEFVAPGDLPSRIQEFCRKTGQPIPETVGAVMRCIYESLALKYRYAIEQLSAVTGRAFTTLHVLGGGTKDRLLCQMTADCCGLTVKAGPVEATALGNIMIQLKALGLLDSITQGRRLIAETEVIKTYTPSTQNDAEWNAAYDRFKTLL